MNRQVIVLHNRISDASRPDERDVIAQVDLVSEALTGLGYEVIKKDFGINIYEDIFQVSCLSPAFVFNLSESVFNASELLYVVPALLRNFDIPFTGSDVESIVITTNKLLTKDILKQNDIPTPEWIRLIDLDSNGANGTFILKPVFEDGSVGIAENAVVSLKNGKAPDWLRSYNSTHYFLEKYLEGREFNIAMLGGKHGPEVLPPAEMMFHDYPEGVPRILSYKAKWNTDSMEYKNTVREFDTIRKNDSLYRKLKDLSVLCWQLFDLHGYARVDFRLDQEGNPYVLEINANPCISPDSGFIAATEKAGIERREVINRIISDIKK